MGTVTCVIWPLKPGDRWRSGANDAKVRIATACKVVLVRICDCSCVSDWAQSTVAIQDLYNVMYLLSWRLVRTPEGLWCIILAHNAARSCTKLTYATGFLFVPLVIHYWHATIFRMYISAVSKLDLYFSCHCDCRKICCVKCLYLLPLLVLLCLCSAVCTCAPVLYDKPYLRCL